MNWQELYNERIAVCHTCDRYNATLHVCKECGCFLKFKARVEKLHCPLKKWPGDIK